MMLGVATIFLIPTPLSLCDIHTALLLHHDTCCSSARSPCRHCTCNSTYPLVDHYTGFLCELQHQSTAQRHPYHCMFHPHQQLNAWLSEFESILKMMTSGNFNWFLHTMTFYHTIKYQRNKPGMRICPKSHVWQYTFQHLTLFTKVLYTTCQKYQKNEMKWKIPQNIPTHWHCTAHGKHII